MNELSCQELVELVTDYLEGTLAEHERARFDEHLANCPGCQAYVEQMRATITLVHETQRLQERPEVAALLAAFRDYKRP